LCLVEKFFQPPGTSKAPDCSPASIITPPIVLDVSPAIFTMMSDKNCSPSENLPAGKLTVILCDADALNAIKEGSMQSYIFEQRFHNPN
jgi:hypothetical protein